MKPVVYIASPYTLGNKHLNTLFQCKMFDLLLSQGQVIPFAPLWSHFQHCYLPRHHQDWIDYDNALIDSGAFDACLRLKTEYGFYTQWESPGADDEVARFMKMGLPVFVQERMLFEVLDELYYWKDRHWKRR